MFGRLLTLTAACAIAAFLAPELRAQGECSDCYLPPSCRGAATGGTKKDVCTVVLLNVESDVDFGRLIVVGGKIGHVVIELTSGSKIVFGDIDDGGGMPIYGTAAVTGQPLRAISVTLPTSVQLSDFNGAQATLRDFRTSLPAFPRLDSTGQLRFNFTGTLYTDAAVLAGGRLRGRVPITVDYN